MTKILSVQPNVIEDTRGEPTIEITLTSSKIYAKASVPCGKSTGKHEAFCHTVDKSINLINEITPQILSKDFSDPTSFDELVIELDGTSNKARLGVNVTLSLSIAFYRLFALSNQLPLYYLISQLANSQPSFPFLFFNLINGGLHVDPRLNPLPFQEYLLIPQEKSPKKSQLLNSIFLNELKITLENKGYKITYGDEGGFIVSGSNPELGLGIFNETLKNIDPQVREKLKFGLDVAASSFYQNGSYFINNSNQNKDYLLNLYQDLTNKYPLLSIEDPFEEDSWESFSKLRKNLGDKILVVGDDLTVTNIRRIQQAKETSSINAVLIKPNQIGTVKETLDAILLTKSFGWKPIISHRSGETNDSFIADLAYGTGAFGLKAGSPVQNQRRVKYERLVEIEDSIIG